MSTNQLAEALRNLISEPDRTPLQRPARLAAAREALAQHESGPAVAGEREAYWREQAALWLHRKASEWANKEHTLPHHWKAYPAWSVVAHNLRWLADELQADASAAPFGLEPWEAHPEPPKATTFDRRFSLARDGFGIVRDDENGNLVHFEDALDVLHAALASQPSKPDQSIGSSHLHAEVAAEMEGFATPLGDISKLRSGADQAALSWDASINPQSLRGLVEGAGGTFCTGGGAAFTSIALAKFVVESHIGLTLQKEVGFPRLYRAINNLLCHIGIEGEINAKHGFVHEASQALMEIDGGTYQTHIATADAAIQSSKG